MINLKLNAMQSNSTASLSWQTGILRFRNLSIRDIRRMLEKHFETEIQLFHRFNSQKNQESSVESEINLVLFISYHLDSDQLAIQAVRQ